MNDEQQQSDQNPDEVLTGGTESGAPPVPADHAVDESAAKDVDGVVEHGAEVADTFEPPLNATKDGYALEVPALLTASQRPQVQELAEDFGRAAKDAGLAGSEAQALLDFVIGHAQQEVEGLNLANQAECLTRTHNLYGPMAKPMIEAAQQGFAKLPQSVKDWLDAPNEAGERKTNSPAVLAMLALWHGGYSKLSPAAAAKELQQIRSGKDYGSKTDRLQQDKTALLGLIASRGKSGDSKALTVQKAPKVTPTAKSKLEAELKTIRMDKGYWDRGAANHKALTARVAAIYGELHPEAK